MYTLVLVIRKSAFWALWRGLAFGGHFLVSLFPKSGGTDLRPSSGGGGFGVTVF